MDKNAKIAKLKDQLCKYVEFLCKRTEEFCSEPILKAMTELEDAKVQAVFFGGLLRGIMFSRVHDRQGNWAPRDLDIVVEGDSIEELRKRFLSLIKRETRFGGLTLKDKSWDIDIWPLELTWAFRNRSQKPSFEDLPFTTFFNVEAVAVDVWPANGKLRTIYSGDDQFFEGILSKTLEVNHEENPFPALCVVRSLVMASSLDFQIGPKLAHYLVKESCRIEDADLEEAQQRHYGCERLAINTMRDWLQYLIERLRIDEKSPIKLPSHDSDKDS